MASSLQLRIDLGVGSANARLARLAAATATADRQQTGLDRQQTGLDRQQTGLDRQQTGLDAIATGQDRSATAADRIQTGQDAVTATTQAGIATAQAIIALAQAGSATGSANAAAASLATAQGITGGVQGIGTGPLMAPRNAEVPPAPHQGPVCIARGAAYQITPHDAQPRVLIAESGTLTWTLPLLAHLDPGWSVRVWNRSGNTLTVNCSGPDVIGAASTSITVADGTGATIAHGAAGARFERIA